MKHRETGVCLVACLGICVLSSFGSEDSAADADVKSKVEEAMAEIRAGDLSKNAVLRQMGKGAVPLLMNHADDNNADVRYVVTMALAESGDERAVPALMKRLTDKDSNVARTAVSGLLDYPEAVLREHASAEGIKAIAAHASKRSRNSLEAVLLLGRLGDSLHAELLRGMLQEARRAEGGKDYWSRMAAEKGRACLKALFSLGEERATHEVVAALRGDDPASIAFAIEAIAYAGKKEYQGELVSLLDDVREAVRVAPDRDYYLRVRDVAANALIQLAALRPSFRVKKYASYSDDEIADIRKLAVQGKTW